MLPILIAGLTLGTKRGMREIVSPRLMDLFKDCELRILVSLSLAIQVLLFALGDRRKKIAHPWIRIVVWTAYLSADAVAIYALGITPGELRQMGVLNSGRIDPTTELKAFWAPFLLMHLGGQDTITANSLEDNELWLRHCLSLVTQTVATFYILVLSWSGSYLSWLFVVILICGLLKYSDRVWALWAASSEQFRDSTPERQRKIPKALEVQKLKEAEGHFVVPHQVMVQPEVRNQEVTISWKADGYKDRLEELLIARDLIDIIRPAFTDLLLTHDDRDASKSALEGKHHSRVFNIISIELGFIYDLLFTKAIVSQTAWGIANRVGSLFLTFTALILFAFHDRRNSYDKIDLGITFALLGLAFSLELYGMLVHLFSDKVICWLIKHKCLRTMKLINCTRIRPLHKRRRWSHKIGQFNLMSYSLKESHLCCHKILGYLGIDDKVEKLVYKYRVDLSDDINAYIVWHLKGRMSMYKDLQNFWEEKWKDETQRWKQLESLKWSIEMDFDTCVLVWHIATHVCMNGNEKGKGRDDGHDWESTSLLLSRYMLYLLVMYPYMLPAGIGRIKFRDMYATMATFFEEHQSTGNEISIGPEDRDNMPAMLAYIYQEQTTRNLPSDLEKQKCCCPKRKRLSKAVACNMLRKQVNTQLNMTVTSEDKSKFVLFHGCKLASQLLGISDEALRWTLVRETWVAMLVLAALKCKASYHLQQLKRGGELLTHVWLCLVQYGLTDHFQIPHAPEIAELNVQ